MRLLILLAFLAACSTTPPPVDGAAKPPPQSTIDPNTLSRAPVTTWSQVAQIALRDGVWQSTELPDAGVYGAGFGPPHRVFAFSIVCSRVYPGIIQLSRVPEADIAAPTALAFIIPGARHVFPAEGGHTANLALNDPRLDAIFGSEAGFVVQSPMETIRVPHDAMLPQVLAQCRGL